VLKKSAALLALAASLAVPASLWASAASVYLSAPFTQTATDSGTTSGGGYSTASIETFNGFSTGAFTSLTSTAIGATLASASGSQIIANGQYGGGLQGNYLGVNSLLTLTFSTPVSYLGLFWCAVDGGNSLSIYDQNNALIGTFNAATFSSILPNNSTSTITAINGTKYNTQNYFGQPTGNAATTGTLANRADNSEQFAYLNFLPQNGAKISKVTINETGATFESDNYAVLSTAPSALGSFATLGTVGTVPEPSTWAAVATGLLGLTLVHRVRRKNATLLR